MTPIFLENCSKETVEQNHKMFTIHRQYWFPHFHAGLLIDKYFTTAIALLKRGQTEYFQRDLDLLEKGTSVSSSKTTEITPVIA